MTTPNFIVETDILVNLPDIKEDISYDFQCFDGYAYGFLTDDVPNAPTHIKMEYPTLAEIKADDDKAEYVLQYRGLFDLTKEDIHYGDVMMAYSEVVKQSNAPIM